jgi:lysophospholipase
MSTTLLRTTDGLSLHTITWTPSTDPKAVIFLIHGIGEHSGRYRHVAQYLNDHGYAVVSYDHRGHGKSEGERVYFTSFDVPVEDMRKVFAEVQRQFPGKKIFIYGHSMGSLISTLYLLKYQDGVSGYISSGSPLGVETTAPAAMLIIGKVIARVAPKLPLVAPDFKTLSRDPKVIQAVLDDPLASKAPTRAGMAAAFVAHAANVPPQLGKITLPILIVHGEADQLTPLVGSVRLNTGVRSADKTMKVYPGLLHELHNEPEQQDVLADIVAWLDARA